ncbi:MAG: carbohydrate-binding family 9-like protein [Nannocystaceae bacterium]
MRGEATSRPRVRGPRRAAALAFAFALPLPACADDVAARAEPPPEPTIVVDAAATARADAQGNIAFAGGVDFVGGLRVEDVEVRPAPARPGEPLTVRMTVRGSDGRARARLGLRTPRSGGHEDARGAPHPADARDRFVDLDLIDGPVEATVEVPLPWHPRDVLLDLEVRDGGELVEAIRGPRTSDGRALLGLVPIARRPAAVVATRGTPAVDGALDDPLWARDPYVLVASLDGEPHAGAPTEVWLAWDPDNLYVAARLPDADLFTEYTEQDDPLYRQEAFELFVAADGSGERYLEYQVSARGVTFDARFPKYRRGDEAWDSRWRTAVAVDGTLDDGSDRDRGWTVEAALPWDELCAETAIPCDPPPAAGARLRINAFRIDRPGRRGMVGLALSPTLRPDFHAWENAAELELR